MHTHGIHHITAIASDVQKNHDFYVNVLGMRLVKKTVNFDAPDVYHLYFGNESGEPGTILTFFPFPDAGTGIRGVGQVTKIYFGVRKDSLGFWLERFVLKGVKHEPIQSRFNEKFITFYDPDGLQLELVATDDELVVKPWKHKDIPLEKAICGFYGAELAVQSEESIADLLVNTMGYSKKDQKDFLIRYENTHATHAKYLDLFIMKGWPEGVSSAGINHHIAFRVKDEKEQLSVRSEVAKAGLYPTDIIDRNYFKSVYFREKNNILFEIATDEPGFTIDEDLTDLGKSLKLPSQYESQRSYIESVLPDLTTNGEDTLTDAVLGNVSLFKHRFVDNNEAKTVVLLHGTGSNEIDMIKFAQSIGIKANFLSVRGNSIENGMYRFFRRFNDGTFDQEDIKNQVSDFEKFFKDAISEYQLKDHSIDFLGFSNGANFALAYTLLVPSNVERVFALHPMVPIEKTTLQLPNTEFIVTYGRSDEYSTPEEIDKIRNLLKPTGAKIEMKEFEGRHTVSEAEVDYILEKMG